MSMGAILLCGGAPGKRFALPNSKILIHQGSAGYQGAPSDIEIHAREVLAMRRRMSEIIAEHTGKSVETVESDVDRDRYMTAPEAKDYGIIDDIFEPRKLHVASRFLPGAPNEPGNGHTSKE
jgi:ATP-dependent Clp protease, protease subunit